MPLFLRMQLIERLAETETVFTEAQERARKDLPVSLMFTVTTPY